VLESDIVLTGRISIEPVHDLILVDDGVRRMVYPAHTIKALYFYDESLNINRKFISIKDKDVIRHQHQLFEIVLQGEVTVLRRQKARSSYPSDGLDFSYFVRYGADMVLLRQFNRKVYPALLSKARARLEAFIAANHLGAANDVNSIRIIEFYNQLVLSEEAVAMH
jgi:hypothetical protein